MEHQGCHDPPLCPSTIGTRRIQCSAQSVGDLVSTMSLRPQDGVCVEERQDSVTTNDNSQTGKGVRRKPHPNRLPHLQRKPKVGMQRIREDSRGKRTPTWAIHRKIKSP